MTLNRRRFLGTTVAAAAALSAPMVRAQGKPRVVVVGGGAGGATAARYIAKDSEGAIDVTLIEPTRTYYTCFFSNLYLGGFKEIGDIGHTYGGLAAGGVNVVHDWAIGVDRDAKTVSLAGGASVPYDKLILSPGIQGRVAVRIAEGTAYGHARRRHLCNGRSAQPIPVPARPVRARLDGCAFPQAAQSDGKDHRG